MMTEVRMISVVVEIAVSKTGPGCWWRWRRWYWRWPRQKIKWRRWWQRWLQWWWWWGGGGGWTQWQRWLHWCIWDLAEWHEGVDGVWEVTIQWNLDKTSKSFICKPCIIYCVTVTLLLWMVHWDMVPYTCIHVTFIKLAPGSIGSDGSGSGVSLVRVVHRSVVRFGLGVFGGPSKVVAQLLVYSTVCPYVISLSIGLNKSAYKLYSLCTSFQISIWCIVYTVYKAVYALQYVCISLLPKSAFNVY